MAELPLNGKRGEGRVVLIDDADLPQVSQHRWHLGKDGYPRTSVGGRSTTLHRLLSRPGEDMLKDHISRPPAKVTPYQQWCGYTRPR